jgi:hypothetical protein
MSFLLTCDIVCEQNYQNFINLVDILPDSKQFIEEIYHERYCDDTLGYNCTCEPSNSSQNLVATYSDIISNFETLSNNTGDLLIEMYKMKGYCPTQEAYSYNCTCIQLQELQEDAEFKMMSMPINEIFLNVEIESKGTQLISPGGNWFQNNSTDENWFVTFPSNWFQEHINSTLQNNQILLFNNTAFPHGNMFTN